MNITEILDQQRSFFRTGKTLDVSFRLAHLKRLAAVIKAREADIADALQKDLGKSSYESYMCETGLVLSEISYMVRHTRRFAKEKRVRTPLAQFASRSYQKPSPYGTVLIMSPWNYPLLLTLDPLVDAVAAGNTAVVKPSAYSPETSRIVSEIIAECFPQEYVAVVTGGREENQALLSQKFDFVFFTGSKAVGHEVLRHTAETLTPAVLELGGKSPCIVDSSAKISLAAKRIVFGKFLNCGQTCVAPDYILCDRSIRDELISAIISEIQKQFGVSPLENPDYGKIISEKHFNRLVGLIDSKNVVFGGDVDAASCRISPTVLSDVSFSDAVMQEEIFGPLLPVLTYDSFSEVVPLLEGREKPLALYIFSEDKSHIREVTERLSFGGGCVNDVVIHLATSEMRFGGVGESGMGSYHGKTGFDTFSHTKSIVDKKTWMDLPMRYQPYKALYSRLLHIFLR